MRLLLVEDDLQVRRALAERLSIEGYEIVTAADGRDALARLREGPLPDVILLDYAMPVMDGRAFREAQVADSRWERIPVILITGYLQRSFAARSLDVAAVLEKPVQWEELDAILRRFSVPSADS